MLVDIMYYESKEMLEAYPRQLQINMVYQHFKGGLYIVVDVARCSETGKELVIYRSLYDGNLWSRPKEMFMDIKETEKGFTYRFRRTSLH